MTVQNATQQLISRLSAIYENNEAATIAALVMEKLTGWNQMNRLTNKEKELSAIQLQQLEQYSSELLQHRPVQYILGEAWLAGMKFYVDEHVLIPRPETEELIEWIGNDFLHQTVSILDIGTGSGCIPVALKKKLPKATVYACDISEEALKIAKGNAADNKTTVQFIQCDILNKNEWDQLSQVDVIFSNPPYIPFRDRDAMQKNVLNYEPAVALFVPDEDPLLFYRNIAELAIAKKATTLYFEIHEEQGNSVVRLLEAKGFTTIELRKDMQGKDRMIKAGLRTG